MFCWTNKDFRLCMERKSHQIHSVAFWPVLNHKERLKFNNQLCLWFSPIKVNNSADGSGLKRTCTILCSCFVFYSLTHWCCHASSVAHQRYWGWRWYFQDSHHLTSSPSYAFWNCNYNSDCCCSWKFSYSFQDMSHIITQYMQKMSPQPTMEWQTASLMFFPLTAYCFCLKYSLNSNSQVI